MSDDDKRSSRTLTVVPQSKLNAKQERFCREYLIDLNATQAALRAGYKDTSAYSQGQRLLKHDEVQRRVQQMMAERGERVGMAADDVLDELRIIGTSDVRDYTVDDDGRLVLADGVPDEMARAVSSIKVKKRILEVESGDEGEPMKTILGVETEIKLWSKPDALKMAGQHHALYRDRKEITGPDGAELDLAPRVLVVIPDNGRGKKGEP